MDNPSPQGKHKAATIAVLHAQGSLCKISENTSLPQLFTKQQNTEYEIRLPHFATVLLLGAN